ncbi:hypothetical protein HA402_015027 [Bradysia odoriphaga]|nr:hypothetical protein HA402_015027 [Bradysia odoriphaga]
MNPVLVIFQALILTSTAQRSSFPLPDVTPAERQFKVVYEWDTIEFAYGSDIERANAIYSNYYIPQNNIISDIKAFANRLYVTLPRMRPGVPATLGWMISPGDNGRTDPEIEPFPSWEMNEVGNCSALQFVQGIAVDTDGIMWVIDSGRVDTLSQGSTRHLNCQPKLLLLDLKRNGSIIHRYHFPDDVAARGNNYLNRIVIDDASGGFAYITDNSGADPGIVVYSRRLNRSWKVRENNSMRAAQNAREFSVNGTDLNFAIHINGIALGPYYNPDTGTSSSATAPSYNALNDNYERNVYYSPLSSYHLYSIPASLLRDPDFARRSTPRDVLQAVTDLGLKISQTDGMIMDNRGILYYGLLKEHALAQWDSYKPFSLDNQLIIAKDDNYIQWTDGMTFDEEGYLYIVVNRLHNFVAGLLRPNDINFRILRAKTGTLSYVYTNSFGARNPLNDNILNRGIFINDVLENGLGISSTPTFSSLEGRNGFGRSSASGFSLCRNITLGLVAIALLQFKLF